LRNDLAHPRSYEHDVDGKGFLIMLGAEYLLTGPWSLNRWTNEGDRIQVDWRQKKARGIMECWNSGIME